MPYIKKEDREKFTRLVSTGNPGDAAFSISNIEEMGRKIKTCGELNYVISVLCNTYHKEQGGRYQQVNDIVGALEGAKLEYYRRVASPYEDEKIEINGDVYDA
jgi:hypothetical protein